MAFTFKDIFSDTAEPHEVKQANWGTDPLAGSWKEGPLVHHNDLEPYAVIAQSFGGTGPWIAGGACLRWYQGQPVGDSDIDVFCANARQAQKLIDDIKSWGRYTTRTTTANATTITYHNKANDTAWTLQVITKRYYNNAQEIIDNFDISVCQIVTDGKQVYLGNNTARDIREKNLRMKEPLMADALKRMVKYWTYGYRPVDGLMESVINNPEGNWKFDPGEDYT